MSANETIPNRQELIERIQRANKVAIPWIAIQFILAVALAASIRWEQFFDQPLIAAVTVLVIVGPEFMEILHRYALPKREIGDLKDQTKYGEFDKFRLRYLVDDTLDRLHLSRPGPPVYITADKSFNAFAMHLGFGGFFRSLNGVYLNRQILHHLTPEEVQDIVGHELGHFYRYYLFSTRFRWLTLLLGVLSAILVAQWMGLSSILSMVALSACGSAFWYVSGILILKNAIAIEYLCDDFGAQVHGPEVSINGLLKVGADNEIQVAIQQQQLSARDQTNLKARDVIEAIEAAIPYGHTTRVELERAVEESIKRRAQQRQQVSLSGFLEFAWRSDEDESEVDELVEKLKLVQRVPRLEWEQLLDRPGRINLNGYQIEQLVDLIESNPDKVLFRIPEELGDSDGMHPPISQRIMFLWKNRKEIESARKNHF